MNKKSNASVNISTPLSYIKRTVLTFFIIILAKKNLKTVESKTCDNELLHHIRRLSKVKQLAIFNLTFIDEIAKRSRLNKVSETMYREKTENFWLSFSLHCLVGERR